MTTFDYADIVCTLMAVLAVAASMLMVSQAVENPVNAVLWLIVAFVAVATYLATMGIAFIGLSYIIVYVGAIAVLFLFVVMMLNLAWTTGNDYRGTAWPVIVVIGIMSGLTLLPLGYQLNLTVDLPLSAVQSLNQLFYGSEAFDWTNSSTVGILPSGGSAGSVNFISQVQALGFVMYTQGALWLMILSVLLMLAIIVPLALAFNG